MVMAIEEKYQEIERIHAKLAQTRGMLFCNKCGAVNPPDAEFCNKCGSSLKTPPKEEPSSEDKEA